MPSSEFAVHAALKKPAKTRDKIKAFVKSSGYNGTGVSREFYVSDPGSTKPEDLKSEIDVPIEAKK